MSEIVVVVLEADFVYSECAAGRLYRNPADLNLWIILLIPELKSSLKTYSGGSKILFGFEGVSRYIFGGWAVGFGKFSWQ